MQAGKRHWNSAGCPPDERVRVSTTTPERWMRRRVHALNAISVIATLEAQDERESKNKKAALLVGKKKKSPPADFFSWSLS